jgi:hypothetical protein
MIEPTDQHRKSTVTSFEHINLNDTFVICLIFEKFKTLRFSMYILIIFLKRLNHANMTNKSNKERRCSMNAAPQDPAKKD